MDRRSAADVSLPPLCRRRKICFLGSMGLERAWSPGGRRYHRCQTSMFFALQSMASAAKETSVVATATAALMVKTVVLSLRSSAPSRLRKESGPDVDDLGNALVLYANPDDAVVAGSNRSNGKGDKRLLRKIVASAGKRIRALRRSVTIVTNRSHAATVHGTKRSDEMAQQRQPFVRLRSAAVALISAAIFVLPVGGARGRPALAATLATSSGWAGKGAGFAAMIPSAGLSGASEAGASVTAAAAVGGAHMSLGSIAPRLILWFTLFVTSAAFHSAEIAITTLYPWKVREFAEEEGESSPFQVYSINNCSTSYDMLCVYMSR